MTTPTTLYLLQVEDLPLAVFPSLCQAKNHFETINRDGPRLVRKSPTYHDNGNGGLQILTTAGWPLGSIVPVESHPAPPAQPYLCNNVLLSISIVLSDLDSAIRYFEKRSRLHFPEAPFSYSEQDQIYTFHAGTTLLGIAEPRRK